MKYKPAIPICIAFVLGVIYFNYHAKENMEPVEVADQLTAQRVLGEILVASQNRDSTIIDKYRNYRLLMPIQLPKTCTPQKSVDGWPPFAEMKMYRGVTYLSDDKKDNAHLFTVFVHPDVSEKILTLISESNMDWPCYMMWVTPEYIEDIIWAGPFGHLVLVADENNDLPAASNCEALMIHTYILKMKSELWKFATLVRQWEELDELEIEEYLQAQLQKISLDCYGVKFELQINKNAIPYFYILNASALDGRINVSLSSLDVSFPQPNWPKINDFSISIQYQQ